MDTRNNQHNPAACYANREEVGYDDNWLSWEKFYLEVSDAPIGCLVGFKSQNPDSLGRDGNPGQQYLCVDSRNGKDLCANRPGIGGDWEQFEVVDAGNGYVALKSFNGNQYLSFNNPNNLGNANGGDAIDSEYEKFQWQNNGDGTISLWNVGARQYLCVDTSNGRNNPAKCYANRDAVGQNSNGISWEKFYCQIQVTGVIETRSETSLPVPQYKREKSQWCWIAVSQMIIHYFDPSSTATQSEIFRKATGFSDDRDVGGDPQKALGPYSISSEKLWVTRQVFLEFSDIITYIHNGQPMIPGTISISSEHVLLLCGPAIHLVVLFSSPSASSAYARNDSRWLASFPVRAGIIVATFSLSAS